MSTDSVKPASKAKKKPLAADAAARKPAPARGQAKTKSTNAGSVKPKPARTCRDCQGKVSVAALYCRHCGKALSSEVPANPYLPPPTKPWRPSRIPKQRPAQGAPLLSDPALASFGSGAIAPVKDLPGVTVQVPSNETGAMPDTPASPASHGDAGPIAPRVWDPVPEVEQRMAQLRAMHDRLRPQLARTDPFKRRLRLP